MSIKQFIDIFASRMNLFVTMKSILVAICNDPPAVNHPVLNQYSGYIALTNE